MRFGAVACVALLSGGVTACQTLNAVGDAVTGPSSSATQTSETPPAAVATTVPATAPTRAGAGGLLGMTSDGLRAAWGEPSMKRTETGVELWQYGSNSCTLLVYFYPGTGDVLTVSRAEALPGGTDEAAVSACAKAAGKPSLKPIS